MKELIENLINNAIDDFNSKWQSHEERNTGVSEYAENVVNKISTNLVLSVRAIIEKHTEKLNTMKDNRSKWEEENWTDAEVQECDRLIAQLAGILSELNGALA